MLKIEELEEISADPDFWNDLENAQKVSQQIKTLKTNVEKYETLVNNYEDLVTLIEMRESL